MTPTVQLDGQQLVGDQRPKLLNRDEARRIAANIGKLPELLRQRSGPTENG